MSNNSNRNNFPASFTATIHQLLAQAFQGIRASANTGTGFINTTDVASARAAANEKLGEHLKHTILRIKQVVSLDMVDVLHLPIDLPYIHRVFSEMINLKQLSLVQGSIPRIENLDTIKGLQFLDLSNNRITSVSNLHHNNNLQVLLLDFNPISSLCADNLVGLVSLRKLSLVGCHISNLWNTVHALATLPNLRELAFQASTDNNITYEMTSLPRSPPHPAPSSPPTIPSAYIRHPTTTTTTTTTATTRQSPTIPPAAAPAPTLPTPSTPSPRPQHPMAQSLADIEEQFNMLEAHVRRTGSMDDDDEDYELADLMDENDDDDEDEDEYDADAADGDDDDDDGYGRHRQEKTNPFSSPICGMAYYREFFIRNLPHLKVLDGIEITAEERARAINTWENVFDSIIQHPPNVLHIFKNRELGAARHTADGWCKRMEGSLFNQFGPPLAFPLCPKQFMPRQFEYNPKLSNLLVFGTLDGQLVVVNHHNSKILGRVSSETYGSILGLCWLHNDPQKFIAGSDSGNLRLYDINSIAAGRNEALFTFPAFDQLTSVNVNCSDNHFLVSGYSKNVSLYDLGTGKLVETFQSLHTEHINVLKFANHHPFLFATSSFDRYIKLWDLRQRAKEPIYTRKSRNGNVMVCWSPCDTYLLCSAVDNEVTQYNSSDGTVNLAFNLQKMHSKHNYTRSYYMNGSDYVIIGSCEENTVRICSAKSGKLLRDVELPSRYPANTSYVQSLRADPFNDFNFSALVAFNPQNVPSEIVKVNLLRPQKPFAARDSA